jgi:hypothetical protein
MSAKHRSKEIAVGTAATAVKKSSMPEEEFAVEDHEELIERGPDLVCRPATAPGRQEARCRL